MLIYANQRKNGAADIIFFHHKIRNWYLGKYKKKKKKKDGEKSLRVLTGDVKKEMLGPSGHHYAPKC